VPKHLPGGRWIDAARLLGRTFVIEGEVVTGDARGRTIGFPTANIRLGEYIHPALGVYAVRVRLDPGEATPPYPAVANLGLRPTFAAAEPLLEVHLFDFEGDLYGRTIEVELVEFLRPEKRFDGLEHLRAQIAEDCAQARRILAGTGAVHRARAAGT
jgi:riboflavin kinase/FMN adenylyltransferase